MTRVAHLLRRSLCCGLLLLAGAAAAVPDEATIEFWNREIAVLRASRGGRDASERARRASDRLSELSDSVLRQGVKVTPLEAAEGKALLFEVGGESVFGLLEGDLDADSGETLAQAGARAEQRLREAIEAHVEQTSLARLSQAIAWSLAATAFYGGVLWVLFRGRRLAVTWLLRASSRSLARASRAGLDALRIALAVIRGLVNLFVWSVTATLAYGWLGFVLFQFPYTQPWGEALGTWLLELVELVASAVVHALPGLAVAAVILSGAYLVTRFNRQFFTSVGAGRIQVSWLRAETAEATRRIVSVLVWVFALAFAYPYLPGSGSVAFQGISVLLGVMLSLGSASLVSNAMSGLVVVYSRAFHAGDFVRVGDTDGVVQELGALSSKIATPGGEVTIPHGVTVSAQIVNYTRQAQGDGSLVTTTVTIGYDAPWRQVHALLLEAAANTAGVRPTPPPRVLQRALSDFYVAYQLVAHVERTDRSLEVLSDLHQQIQDRFNAHGVQIMSPHFAIQPGRPVVVPQSRWFDAPAAAPAREKGARSS